MSWPLRNLTQRVWRRLRQSPTIAYADWCRRFDNPSPSDLERLRAVSREWQYRPLVSVIMPVHNPPEGLLRAAVRSVFDQVYDHWELCLADDGSAAAANRGLRELAAAEPRIRLTVCPVTGGIARATNAALELASGDYLVFLDHDDLLRPHSLFCVVEALQTNREADLLYSDEDKISLTGERFMPYFKPDWNPELLRQQNYLCHLVAARRSLVQQLGGLREGFDGAQDWDLVLRLSEATSADRIRHLPWVLYHWRSWPGSTADTPQAKTWTAEAALRTVRDHLDRTGITAVAEAAGQYLRIRYDLPDPPPAAAVIIPTRNHRVLLANCLDSLRQTEYPDWKLVIVDNDSDDEETLNFLAAQQGEPQTEVLRVPGGFNFSRICNQAVRQVQAAVVVLLNDDTEALHPGWLREIVSLACRPDVGAVGAKLYYPDGRLQHAGVVLGIGGIAGHWHKGAPGNAPGPGAQGWLRRNVAAVTGACLGVGRDKYLAVGGFDEEHLPVAFGDVDFCLRLQASGLRNVWTPLAELCHHESSSRGPEDTPEKMDRFAGEIAWMQARWQSLLQCDPYYNPNLTLEREDLSLATPPRACMPWDRR